MNLLIGLAAALIALLTAMAMLKDTRLTQLERQALADIFHRARYALQARGWRGIDYDEVRIAVRFVLRAAALILIVASAGVTIVLDLFGAAPSLYDALLRLGLAVFLAMQAPCPWIRWIAIGDRRQTARQEGGGLHVQ